MIITLITLITIITLKIKKTILILYIILTERKKEKKSQRKKKNPNLSLHGRTTKNYIYMYTYNIINSGITWEKREEYDGRGEISMTHGTTVCKNLFRYANV